MSFPLVSATPQNFRQDLCRKLGDWWPSSTTGAGTTTTVVDSSLSGWGDNEFQEWYVLMTGGAAANQWRIVDSFTASTLTLRTALGSASGNASAYELHKFRPDWYKLACNEAIRVLWPAVYRPVKSYLPISLGRSVYPLPRNMVDCWNLQQRGYTIFTDAFDSLASGWKQTAGTWGVISSRLRSTSDADADLLTEDFNVRDPIILCTVTGTLNSATVYRCPSLVFHYNDSSNYLVVRLLNGVVDLRKVDGGGESPLTTATQTTADGTDYVVLVECDGAMVRVWVDDVQLIEYRLVGTDTKYIEYTTAGFRLDKAGAPATAARWDTYSISRVFAGYDWPEYLVDSLSRSITFQRHPGNTRLFQVEGGAPLSQLAADTTAGTLASDTTAGLEIQTADAAWELLLTQGAAELYAISGSPMNAHSPEERTAYQKEEAAWRTKALDMRNRLYQPRRIGAIRHPGRRY